jgi:hypothetical protein
LEKKDIVENDAQKGVPVVDFEVKEGSVRRRLWRRT